MTAPQTPKPGVARPAPQAGHALHRPKPVTARRAPEAGFTLIETLVALAVLAVSAVALLAATQAHVERIAGLEQRAAAGWVAQNRLAEVALGLASQDPAPAMLGHAFVVTVGGEPTTDPDLQKLVVTATGDRSAARLTGFVLADATAGPAP